MKKSIADSIQKVLARKNVSQRQLAIAIGKPATQLNKWVLGKNEIGVSTLIEIADALNVTLDELVGREVKGMTNIDILSEPEAEYRNVNEMDVKTLQKEMAKVKKDLSDLKKLLKE